MSERKIFLSHRRKRVSASNTARRSPFTESELAKIFQMLADDPERLVARETNELEFKESFGWRSLTDYARTMAAYANTDGGYLVFGVDNKRYLVGLNNDLFDNIDPQKLTEGLNQAFSPEIRWSQYLHNINGKKIGLIFVYPSSNKPVVAIKDNGEIREADIYYRYAGRTERIKYPELQTLLDGQRRKELDLWLKHLSRIAKIGVYNAAVMDTIQGTVTGAGGSFVIDQSLLPLLSFIREGHFVENDGAMTLKLVGHLESLPPGFIRPTIQRLVRVPKPIRTTDIIYAFLDQVEVGEPFRYVEQICFEDSAFLPIYYFIWLSKLDISTLREQLSTVISRKNSKARLLHRLQSEDNLSLAVPRGDRPVTQRKRMYLQQVKDKSLSSELAKEEAISAIHVMRCLQRDEVELSYLAPILKQWFNQYYADKSIANGGDTIRRTICHLDWLLYKSQVIKAE
jgi:hypothetical protein